MYEVTQFLSQSLKFKIRTHRLFFLCRSFSGVSVWYSYRMGHLENGILANYYEYESSDLFGHGVAIRCDFRKLSRVCSYNGAKEKYYLRKSLT